MHNTTPDLEHLEGLPPAAGKRCGSFALLGSVAPPLTAKLARMKRDDCKNSFKVNLPFPGDL